MRTFWLSCLLLGCRMGTWGQTGSPTEPVRYIGGEICNPRLHEGGFRYAIGAENIQALRANRTRPEKADDYGWTYNHAPNLTYWNGKFYLQYLSNPADEQQPPGHTLLVTSVDGRSWGKPQVVFPVYKAPEGVTFPKPYYGYIMHQRMGFYTAPDGRLLILGFYGHSYNPFMEGGIGRVVREIYKDGSMGPIYFIRYSSHAETHPKWDESNTTYPFYTRSEDKGFVAACDSLLNDKLKTLQWIDEDRGTDGFYTLKEMTDRLKATSYYHRKDGKVVALWKKSWVALSDDNGLTWHEPMREPSLIMAGGKNWGQRTADGRYAMCYNPIETQPYRYPLIVTTSDDGIVFDNMCVLHGEVPPRRFFGENKDFGPCYVRGITEGEQQPDDNCMWVTYSVNKEDIWITRVPLPITREWEGPVKDNFDNIEPKGKIPNWNIYRPRWAEVYVDDLHRLCLNDSDRYDYARVIRVFETSRKAKISFDILIEKEQEEPFEVDVTDAHGERAVSLRFHKGQLSLNGKQIGSYTAGKTRHVTLEINTDGTGATSFDGQTIPNLHAVKSIERLSFRTGAYRNLPDRNTPNQEKYNPLDNCDTPCSLSRYFIDNVSIK